MNILGSKKSSSGGLKSSSKGLGVGTSSPSIGTNPNPGAPHSTPAPAGNGSVGNVPIAPPTPTPNVVNAAGQAPLSGTPVTSVVSAGNVPSADQSNKLNLLDMLHAALDACKDGESIVITKFKNEEKSIKLRWGYSIATQTTRKTVYAKGIKEAFKTVLEELVSELTPKRKKRQNP